MKIIQTRLSIKQMKLDFFTEYTRRYQEIILHLLENINKPDFDFSTLKEADHEKFDETMRYIRVYFDLWSEEYYLHQEGKIVNSP
ncbi:MAG TPA: hypothetical protein VI583_08880 [Cyclobacteriaceae bacterium]|nr:hypothetical protein [Cyclobacteriaceae bacterium]